MDINFQHVTARTNKDGSKRYYFRRRGYPLERLPDDPTSEEFAAEYHRLKNRAGLIGASDEGSFAWLCDQYMDSAAFKARSSATRAARRRIILSMTREPIDPRHPERFGQEHQKNISARHIIVLRDRKAAFPNAANERLKILRQIFKVAVANDWRKDNPAEGVENVPVRTSGHDTATDEQLDRYLAFHKGGAARVAIVLLMAFGMRVSDLRILGPQHVRKGLLCFRTVKTKMLCELTIDDRARPVIDGCDKMVFLTNEHGAGYKSDKALSQRVSKWFRQAGVDGITAHSVRKWLATRMADRGATEYELMSWFGWKDPKEARPYVEAANRRRLAASAGKRAARK